MSLRITMLFIDTFWWFTFWSYCICQAMLRMDRYLSYEERIRRVNEVLMEVRVSRNRRLSCFRKDLLRYVSIDPESCSTEEPSLKQSLYQWPFLNVLLYHESQKVSPSHSSVLWNVRIRSLASRGKTRKYLVGRRRGWVSPVRWVTRYTVSSLCEW